MKAKYQAGCHHDGRARRGSKSRTPFSTSYDIGEVLMRRRNDDQCDNIIRLDRIIDE